MSTLKKYAYGLLLTTIGLINFCNATDIYTTSKVNINLNAGDETTINKGYCFTLSNALCAVNLKAYDNGNLLNQSFELRGLYCFNKNLQIKNASSNSCTIYAYTDVYENISDYCPTCPTCDPQYTSQECQNVYGLVSSGLLTSCESDLLSCTTDLSRCQSNTSGFNDLLNSCYNSLNACNSSLTSCLQANCPEIDYTGGNWSALYINNIQYNGAPTIRVTIPEEIERDNYTDEEETTIDVIGYGYDQDKMQQMVNTQYYKPTAEEMNGLIEKIADFLPLVAVALLITRLRRVIKKVF